MAKGSGITVRRSGLIKRVEWAPSDDLGPVMIKVTDKDKDVLLPLVGQYVDIETTFTPIDIDEPLEDNVTQTNIPEGDGGTTE